MHGFLVFQDNMIFFKEIRLLLFLTCKKLKTLQPELLIRCGDNLWLTTYVVFSALFAVNSNQGFTFIHQLIDFADSTFDFLHFTRT